jgi:hypothetical protein
MSEPLAVLDRATPRRAGFTLFEVALSLVLVATGVVTLLILLPTGMRQINLQRYRTYAAAVANQLIDVYAHADPSYAYGDHEGPGPWDVPVDRRVNAPDLELRCSNQRYGLLPLPLEIARRIDSDGDELKSLLDRGGYVYYLQPNVANAWRDDLMPVAPPNDLQRMIVGVVGDAQHNAAFSLPMKRWPYYGTVPAPPLHVIHNPRLGWDSRDPLAPGSLPRELLKPEDAAMPQAWKDNHATYCWQACVDPDPRLVKVFNGFWDYIWIREFPTERGERQRVALGAYVQAVVDYCAASALTAADLTRFLDTPPLMPYPWLGQDPAVTAKKVLALTYLSHALMCLTRWHKLDRVVNGLASLTDGVDLPAAYPVSYTSLTLPAITHTRITNLVRNVRYVYFRFTASDPYNWAVPRPIEHATMMDYPLLELDLFRAPAAGAIWGAPAGVAAARQWKYLSPAPITTVPGDPNAPFGASLTYPLGRIPAPDATSPAALVAENGPGSGGGSHFTLTNRFEASERCRQLVFWVVDWQSYEDCETASSAPVDASRYPKAAPGGVKPANGGADGRGLDGSVASCTGFDDLMWGFTDGWGDATGLEQVIRAGGENIRLYRALVGSYVHMYRNPEKNLMFTRPVAALATGDDVSQLKIRDFDRNAVDLAARRRAYTPPDYGPPGIGAPEAPEVFSGRFGADRNGNDRLDRGAIPRSVRMRAQNVARFNYYDMRVSCQLR